MTDATATAPANKPENLLLNLACNVALPTAIMTWGSGVHTLGPKWGLVVALLFPIGYGSYDFVQRRRFNFISGIGFISVLVSGTFGLMKLDGFWFAVKDAVLPSLIGIAILASMRAREPLVHELIYNPMVIDVDRVDTALEQRGAQGEFDRLSREASFLLALSFFISAGLSFALARYLLRSPAGTEAFNGELAKMHWASLLMMLFTSLPMMMYALWRLLSGLEKASGLTFDEILRSPPPKGAAGSGSTPPDPGGGK